MSYSDTHGDLHADLGEDPNDSEYLAEFSVPLHHRTDRGSSFRVQNDPSNPWQRANVIERKGDLDMRCSLLDVVHGKLTAEGNEKATLLVIRFRFDPRRRARRFKSANINLNFKGIDKDEGPAVMAIAPDAHLKLGKSMAHTESKQSAGLQVSGGMPAAAGGTISWETSTSMDVTTYASNTGSIDLRGRNWGSANCASWSLSENENGERGIPPFLKTAVLLRRENYEPFRCMFTIDAAVDIRSKLGRYFGRKDDLTNDDPVLFDPSIKANNISERYNQDNLGSCDLYSLSDITFRTDVHGTVKELQQTG
ncbi:hypothetical protein M409DRAFT_56940 [Zasmidium cellare ATCC 36951]|uniref:Uncharacterized protein n=1 Tax=Zasmidium cellare ATCC 36951 TaxID=1080233 RepID=A0A6A6CBU5_ZASCE|nr:uncharacterized protein M409DRAFT_56940 [Zasmidium cellare ATCC 36951]KAF2164253.1 hypothetical protein M409DRAFT_56940 [Zasmidium cellare ATCC 36951]